MAGIIQKGSSEHNAHLARLKEAVKGKDKDAAKAAAEDLARHESKPAEEKKDK